MCDKCENGWIKVGDDQFNQCECPLGQQLRRFTAVVTIANEDQRIKDSMAWYERKLAEPS